VRAPEGGAARRRRVELVRAELARVRPPRHEPTEPKEEEMGEEEEEVRRIALSEEAHRTVCGLVQPTDVIDPGEVFAPEEVWAEIHAAFPAAAYGGGPTASAPAPGRTGARPCVKAGARGLVRHLAALSIYADGGILFDRSQASVLLGIDGPADREDVRAAAVGALDDLAGGVEATTTFEVGLAGGEPERRLCFECETYEESHILADGSISQVQYEVRRVLYRHPEAEIELGGEDREVAEAFARRVVPELAG
jgi:hypothetical protein